MESGSKVEAHPLPEIAIPSTSVDMRRIMPLASQESKKGVWHYTLFPLSLPQICL